MSITTRLQRLERAAALQQPLRELIPREMTDVQLAEVIASCQPGLTTEEVLALDNNGLQRLMEEFDARRADGG
jgi:hypothetical protein